MNEINAQDVIRQILENQEIIMSGLLILLSIRQDGSSSFDVGLSSCIHKTKSILGKEDYEFRNSMFTNRRY